eukprot:15457924-Alexandrium_andersonii.AAC.1
MPTSPAPPTSLPACAQLRRPPQLCQHGPTLFADSVIFSLAVFCVYRLGGSLPRPGHGAPAGRPPLLPALGF